MQKLNTAFIVLLGLICLIAFAQTGPGDAKELAPFLDGAMKVAMETNHVPGAVVAVVKDGKILLSKGYGYADLEKKQKVDPDKTLFRIGSVTKVFIWTSVMQLAEQGKLKLDADVNTYLKDFKIPQTYPQPITLLNLMAHNAGFEDRVIGLFARTSDKMVPLGQLLASDLPARVRPPGQLSGYSNHGVGLVGYIIAQLSGRSVEEYLEQNIFKPLGMSHTTLRQPVPQQLQANLAKGYAFKNGRYVENPFTFVPLAPAGGISASATDMARFMIAHLQLGQYGQGRILQQATAQEMHRTHFRHDPRVGGWAHGFAEEFHGGLRAIGHGGGTNDFFTEFTLIPEKNLGIFASFNGVNGFNAQQQVVKAFWDRYFPVEVKPVEVKAESTARAAQVAGYYGSTRSCSTTCRYLP